MIKFTTSTSGLDRLIARLDKAGPRAAEMAATAVASDVVGFMLTIAPRDTNRYARGWAQAGNKAGAGPFPLPPVIKSAYADKLAARLDTQLVRYQKMLDSQQRYFNYWDLLYQRRYVEKNRTGKWARDAQRKRDAVAKKLDRLKELVERAKAAVEMFDKGNVDGALVIWGKGAKQVKNPLAFSRQATVRDKIYGGDGRMFKADGRVFITIHNLEPHSSIIEKKHRVLARAMARARTTGLQRMSRKALAEIRKAA